jgi:membrane peptidoglycan carboxypeptidase
MSDNWKQDANHNNQNVDRNVPPKTGGLLRNYNSQQGDANQPISPRANPTPPPAEPIKKKTGLLGGAYNQPSPPAEPAKKNTGLLGGAYNQSPPVEPARKKTGLLGGAYNQLPPAQAPLPPSVQAGSQSLMRQSQMSGGPAVNQPHRGGGLLSNAASRIQQWSGKMSSLAGRSVEPPAPYLDRYRPMAMAAETRAPEIRQQSKRWKRSKTLRMYQHVQKRRQRMQRGPNQAIVISLAVFAALIIFGSFGSGAYGYSYYVQQQPKVSQYADQKIPQDTRIYDRNGILLYDVYDNASSVYNGRRVTVTYDDIPKVMQNAMIAIEDKNFWTDNGIDPVATVRAATTGYGGGSTLTQQVIKNLTHDTTYSYTRKLTEAALAIGLTQQYPKSKILEMYFNVAPFGAQTLGVEVAAEDYFGLKMDCSKVDKKCIPAISELDYNTTTKKKDPVLGLARASLLAAQPNGPTLTDPTLGDDNVQRSLARQKLILNAMIEQHMTLDDGTAITVKIAQEAESLMAKQKFVPYTRNKRAPHFVDWIINQVETALGGGSDGAYDFMTGGYNIRTTIDINLNDYTQAAITRHLDRAEQQLFPTIQVATLSKDNNVNDGAAIVLDAKNGEILSMVGSASYDDNDVKVRGEYNVAAPPDGGSGRAPGSTFKPIEYATAFEEGWYPGMIVPDQLTAFPNGMPAGTPVPTTLDKVDPNSALYVPPDYGNSYHGTGVGWTLRLATANSLNVGAMRAMQYAGPANVLDTAKRLGITTLTNNGMAWGLGAQNVPLIQMAGAYQTFANSGVRVPPQGILNIYDNQGNSLYKYDEKNPPATRVFSPQVSYMMTSILIDEPSRALEFAGDHDLSFTDKDPTCGVIAECTLQVAAKTGTTDNYVDNLTIGYTPDVVTAVWAGNADNTPMVNVVGITGAAPIWHSVMERTLGWCNVATDDVACGPNYNFQFSANPTRTFTNPGGINKQSTSILTGLLGTGVNDYVIDGQAPQQAGPAPTPPPASNPPKGSNPPGKTPGKPGKTKP